MPSSLLIWYILITLIGWMSFPLTYRLLPALADRGYSLARAFGLMVWGYLFWMLAMLGITPNDPGGLLLALAIVAGFAFWSFSQQRAEILDWIRGNRNVVITSEVLFVIAFSFFAMFRAASPEILGTEKPMELMFINGIMNSPTFPPRDPWLSGFSISYYYFGYVMTSMLALISGIRATVAFNLMLSLVYGLSAIGAYGLVYNLLQTYKLNRDHESARRSSHVGALLGPVFLLLVSNMEGLLEVFHARGWFWKDGYNFWIRLDLPELRDMPLVTGSWLPDRYWWWWRASRVVQDYDLLGNHLEAIDEFPAFSFLLGDLHPHVLAIPFFLLALSVALNLLLGGFRGKINLNIASLHINKPGFFLSAFMLGGMAFLNTWDILPVGAVLIGCYVLARVEEAGWSRERTEDAALLAVPLAVSAYILYLPFFIGFDSQAGGLVPNFMYITRGMHLWVMWGWLLIPIFAYLAYNAFHKVSANWKAGTLSILGIVLLLIALMMTLGYLAYKLRPEIVLPFLQSQQRDANTFLADSFARRWDHIKSLITLLALLIPSAAYLFAPRASENDEKQTSPSTRFIVLLTLFGGLLILGPDFLYLRDNFGYRINTIFKFYYQAWILLSIAAAYGSALLLRNLRGISNIVFSFVMIFVIGAGLIYPIYGFIDRSSSFNPVNGFTLDDMVRYRRDVPEEAHAIDWLLSAPDGIIIEATGNPYSAAGRFATYTGLPTVLGWSNHEGQWRDTALQGTRKQDIETLYATPDWLTAKNILEQYDVRYVIVGIQERLAYRVNEDKFSEFLRIVFQEGSTTIYEVP